MRPGSTACWRRRAGAGPSAPRSCSASRPTRTASRRRWSSRPGPSSTGSRGLRQASTHRCDHGPSRTVRRPPPRPRRLRGRGAPPPPRRATGQPGPRGLGDAGLPARKERDGGEDGAFSIVVRPAEAAAARSVLSARDLPRARSPASRSSSAAAASSPPRSRSTPGTCTRSPASWPGRSSRSTGSWAPGSTWPSRARSLRPDARRTPRASVLVKCRPDARGRLDAQADGLRRMVAGAAEGLDPASVSVLVSEAAPSPAPRIEEPRISRGWLAGSALALAVLLGAGALTFGRRRTCGRELRSPGPRGARRDPRPARAAALSDDIPASTWTRTARSSPHRAPSGSPCWRPRCAGRKPGAGAGPGPRPWNGRRCTGSTRQVSSRRRIGRGTTGMARARGRRRVPVRPPPVAPALAEVDASLLDLGRARPGPRPSGFPRCWEATSPFADASSPGSRTQPAPRSSPSS